ncbi:MAG: hypothetical protein JW703_00560 [Candidatus Diapherotrites archaeon]|nr:hypothetical protein [Candidatus Diapherotrites archaeon]
MEKEIELNSKILIPAGIIIVILVAVISFLFLFPQNEFDSFNSKTGLSNSLHESSEELMQKNPAELESIKTEIESFTPRTDEIKNLKQVYLDYIKIIIKLKETELIEATLGMDLCSNISKYELIAENFAFIEVQKEFLKNKNSLFLEKYPDYSEQINFNKIYFDETISTQELNELIESAKEVCR